MEFWLGIILLGLMGFSLGLLGGGGSILAVPILTSLMIHDPHEALALSLVLVGSTALVAALIHHHGDNVDWRSGGIFAACGVPLNLGGSWLATRLPGALLMLLFGVLMLVAGAMMFRPRPEPREDDPSRHPLAVAAGGAAVGFMTGFLGVGGGFVTVPALVLYLKLPMKRAVGTSLFVIALNSAIATYGHRHNLRVEGFLVAAALVTACAGSYFGVLLSQRLAGPQLKRYFAIFIIGVGTWMVTKNAATMWP